MKPHDDVKKEFVRQWLLKAEEDFNAAASLLTYGTTFINTVCFHSQQAVEKYIKAFLTYHQIEFPKTHDIGKLLDLISLSNSTLSESLHESISLTSYGVDSRYPGEFPEVTIHDAQEAIQIAGKVRKLVLELL